MFTVRVIAKVAGSGFPDGRPLDRSGALCGAEIVRRLGGSDSLQEGAGGIPEGMLDGIIWRSRGF